MGARLARGGEASVTIEEVEKHITKDDAWIILFGEAIDVTRFLPLHPGGEDQICVYLGKDATKDWQHIHSPDTIESNMAYLRKMGRIETGGGLLQWLFGKRAVPAAARLENKVDQSEPPALEERTPVRWTIEHEAELMPGGAFDLAELSRWDGVHLPMCIGICGLVIDVSASQNFVPDFGYGKLWAGKDTTWAMATVSLNAGDANRFDFDLEELTEEQLKTLAGWYKHFTHKYRTVGTLKELRDWDFSKVEVEAKALPLSSMSQSDDTQC